MRNIAFAFLLCACAGSQPSQPGGADLIQTALSVFLATGDAVLRVDGYAALEKYAKEALPIVDANADKVITLAELQAVTAQLAENPQLAAGVLAAAYFLHKK